jgi:radical SAM protein with 4Fe4S-binding SPASM domain
MLGVTKLLCSIASVSDSLQKGRETSKLPARLLQFSSDKRPVIVWNITNRCNLHCLHCYSSSGKELPGELSTEEGLRLIDDLADYKVPVIIFSGGDPLMRKDLFTLAGRAYKRGMRCALSTNGLFIDRDTAKKIKDTGFSYVGVSLDGIGETNDLFRGMRGAFEKGLSGLRHCHAEGITAGLRFNLNKRTMGHLKALFDLIESEGIPRGYVSHLVYSGRGSRLKNEDLSHEETRKAVDYIFQRVEAFHRKGLDKEILLGNNDADGIYLYLKVKEKNPFQAERVYELLKLRGGNSSGVALGNIDSIGNVHADQFWQYYSFGNVKKRGFGEIWEDRSDPLMAGLKKRKDVIKGRCGECKFLDICGGNYRVRAEAVYGDVWESDPACYLSDEEIGLS